METYKQIGTAVLLGTHSVQGTRTGGEQLAFRIEVVYYTFSAIKNRSVRRRLFPKRSFHALFSDPVIFSSPFVLIFSVCFLFMIFFLFRAENSSLTQNMHVDNKLIFDFRSITATHRPRDVLYHVTRRTVHVCWMTMMTTYANKSPPETEHSIVCLKTALEKHVRVSPKSRRRCKYI